MDTVLFTMDFKTTSKEEIIAELDDTDVVLLSD